MLFLNDTEDLAPCTLHNLTLMYCTTVGRDKTWKFVQNFSRFLFYILSATTSSTAYIDYAERVRNLWKNLSNARKGFRLGKSIIHADKFCTTMFDKNRTALYKCIDCLKRSILFCHEACDNLFWFSKFNIIQDNKRSVVYKQWAYMTKGIGEALSLCLHATELARLCRLEASGTAQRSDVRKQRAKVYRRVTKSACDAIGAFINAKYALRLFGWSGNDGVMGFLGIVSAFMSLVGKYPRMKVIVAPR